MRTLIGILILHLFFGCSFNDYSIISDYEKIAHEIPNKINVLFVSSKFKTLKNAIIDKFNSDEYALEIEYKAIKTMESYIFEDDKKLTYLMKIDVMYQYSGKSENPDFTKLLKYSSKTRFFTLFCELFDESNEKMIWSAKIYHKSSNSDFETMAEEIVSIISDQMMQDRVYKRKETKNVE